MKEYRKFPKKYLLLLILFGLLITSSAVFYYEHRKDSIRTQYAFSLEAVAKLKIDQITEWNEDRLLYAGIIAKDKRVISLLNFINYNNSNKALVPELLKSVIHYKGSDGLLTISFADTHNNIIANAFKVHDHFNESILPVLSLVQKTHQPAITEIHKPAGYEIHYGVVVPVFNGEQYIGTIIAEFSLDKILNLSIPKWPYSSSTGEIIIAAKHNDNVLFLSRLKNEKNTELVVNIPLSDSLPAALGIKGKRGIVEGFDYKKDEVLAYVDSIPGTSFILVSKINKEEMYSALKLTLTWLIVSGTILFLTMTLIALTLWKSNSAKFYKAQGLIEKEKNNLKKYNEYLSKYANDMIFLMTSEGRILDTNEKACKVYGYAKEEFLTMTASDIQTKPERSLIEQLITKINSNDGYLFETVHTTKSGRTFPVEINSRLFETDGEKLIQSTVRDITERKVAEELLKKSELKFRNFAENIDDIIYIYRTSPKLHFEFVSPSVNKILGYTPEDFYKDPLLELQIIHPEDTGYMFGDYNLNKSAKNQVLRYIHKDGHIVWMEQTRAIHFDRQQKIEVIFSVARDVTERIKTEQSLQESEKRYKSLAQFLPVGIFKADTQFNCLYVNEKWGEIVGVNPDQALGKNWIESVHPDDREMLWQKSITLIQNDFIDPTEYRFIKPDGTVKWVLGNIAPEFNHKGEVKGYVGSITDITEIKNMEEAIRYQNLRYDTLLKTSVEGIHILDENGNVIQANNTFCNLLGYNSDDILKLNVADWNDIYTPERFQNDLQSTLLKPRIFEATMKRKDGSIIDAEISATAIVFNEQVMIFCSARDITERKKTQKQIIDSETKFRSLYELANDAILLIDPSTYRIVDCNPSAEELFGTEKKLLINKMPADLSPALQPDGSISEVLSEFYLNKCNQNQFIRFDWTYYKSFEQPVEVEVSFKKINMNSHGMIQAIVRDMSHTKKQEEQIKLLYTSVEQSPASIVITDVNGIIEYVNSKCLEVTGYTKEEVLGQNPRMFQSGETPVYSYEEFWDTILNGEEWRGEFLNKKKNGELYWETAIVSPVKNDAGEIIHFVGIKEDITSRKQMEADLIKAKDKAEEMNRLKNAFLANISHELRTPLVGILGGASIINEEAENPDVKEFSKIIIEGANRLNDTLNSLIDISKLESSLQPVKMEKINIVPLIKENLDPFTPAVEAKKLQLKFNSNDEIAYVNADPNLLSKSIHYLVHNAIKYTEKGEINLSLERVNHSIVLKVEDTGIGIPQSFNQEIFEPFRQASEGLSRRFEGNGLGLSITKKFVELMKGDIWFESSEGVGSSFYVRLNRVDE